MRSPLLALLLVLPLSACSGDDEPPAQARPSAAATAASGAPSPSTSSTDPVLEPTADGLTVRVGSTVQELPFGSAARDVVGALDAVLGPQDEVQSVACAQGGRTATTFLAQTFSVVLEDDEMVGWVSRSPELPTDTGLRVGSTRAEVEAALPDAEFTEDGPGFRAEDEDGLSGTLDGSAPTSTVTQLTGGEDCTAR